MTTRKVVDRASSRPPPRALEEIAAMLGIGSVSRAVRVLRRLERKVRVLDQEGGKG